MIGQVVDVRVLGEAHKWSGTEGGMAQLELDEQAAVGNREDQYGCGEQRAGGVQFASGLCCALERSGSYHRCSTRLEFEDVATSLVVPRRTMHWQC